MRYSVASLDGEVRRSHLSRCDRVHWDYYDVGCMTHRWNDAKNAIACAKKVIKLRFKNYGKITVINNA